jgi:hypothetical protein
VETRARWTPVGTYAALAGLLVAIALGAAGLMHIAEHESIPWSTLPIQAQRFAMGVEGIGLSAALVLLVLLLIAHRLVEVRPEVRAPAHVGLAAVLAPGLVTHAAMAVVHIGAVPAESIHLGLIVLGAVAVCLVVALAVTGAMIRRGSARRFPRLLHRPLSVALALVVAGHIVVAASHSAMHNSFV